MSRRNNSYLCLRGCTLVLAALMCASAHATEPPRDPLRFDIQVIPGAERYLDFLAYPAYLAVALENNGVKPSNSGRVTIVDGKTLRFKSALLQFTEKKGTTYKYQSSLEWDIGPTQVKFKVPAEIDTASLSSGKISVRIYPPFAKLFPQALVERVNLKVQALTDVNVQKKMLSYFDGLAKNQPAGWGVDGMLSQILVQAYNTGDTQNVNCISREPGDAEPLSDQVLFLATLIIWLVIVPLGIYLWRFFKRRRTGG